MYVYVTLHLLKQPVLQVNGLVRFSEISWEIILYHVHHMYMYMCISVEMQAMFILSLYFFFPGYCSNGLFQVVIFECTQLISYCHV